MLAHFRLSIITKSLPVAFTFAPLFKNNSAIFGLPKHYVQYSLLFMLI